LPKRREPTVKDLFEPLEATEIQMKPKRDPAEIRIYVKALKRAIKFLPLGSRAYYYLSGEIVRANRELSSFTPAPFSKGLQ